jgi:hypothetical protein
MRIIAFIEEDAVIRKILSHLNLWLPQYHDPPDIPDSYNISAALTADSNSPIVNIDLESTQLNLFSDRSYEWWEAGNRLNSSFNTYQNSSAAAEIIKSECFKPIPVALMKITTTSFYMKNTNIHVKKNTIII